MRRNRAFGHRAAGAVERPEQLGDGPVGCLLRLAAELRAAIPDLALTTDVIVGFPGETERDFEETLEVVEEVGFDGAYTFLFSPRRSEGFAWGALSRPPAPMRGFGRKSMSLI